MKRPQPSVEELILKEFITYVGGTRKFARTWGHNNNVLNEKIYFIRDQRNVAKDNKKLWRLLGNWEDVRDFENPGNDDIKHAWVYLNKNKFNVEFRKTNRDLDYRYWAI